MFEKLEKKVNFIREQPEYIRMRYVWIAVGTVMFLVIFIWLISLKTSFLQMHNNPKSQQNIEDIKKRIHELNPDNAPSTKKPVSIDELLENTSKKDEI